jgi:hypothetical protein
MNISYLLQLNLSLPDQGQKQGSEMLMLMNGSLGFDSLLACADLQGGSR